MTRIISTLGPASNTPRMIEAMVAAGTNVLRLNMSHGTLDDKAEMIRNIRAVEIKVKRPIAIMADLQGPKLRIGKLKGGAVKLAEGAEVRLENSTEEGDEARICLPHPEIFEVIEAGMRILLDDGKIQFEVVKAGSGKNKGVATCRVVVGGTLKDRKGVNVPGAVLPVDALTKTDREHLEFALDNGVDWIALSFVQRAEDVTAAKALVEGRAGVLAKIERPAALTQLDEIVNAADAVMVARGDLGVEAPVEDVPTLQRRIVATARRAGKPVVVATQMLESMIESPVPTRAEVSDVATAVFEAADAIMLSAESAVGKNPVEAVRVMDRVARRAEADPYYGKTGAGADALPNPTAEDAITAAARQVARTIGAAAIVTFTTSGSTALRASRERPRVPILVLTPNPATARRLTMAWGLRLVTIRDVQDFEEMVSKSTRVARREGLAEPGDRIVITAGVPFGTPGATNVLHIANVPDEDAETILSPEA